MPVPVVLGLLVASVDRRRLRGRFRIRRRRCVKHPTLRRLLLAFCERKLRPFRNHAVDRYAEVCVVENLVRVGVVGKFLVSPDLMVAGVALGEADDAVGFGRLGVNAKAADRQRAVTRVGDCLFGRAGARRNLQCGAGLVLSAGDGDAPFLAVGRKQRLERVVLRLCGLLRRLFLSPRRHACRGKHDRGDGAHRPDPGDCRVATLACNHSKTTGCIDAD